jgi:hypothetical protein
MNRARAARNKYLSILDASIEESKYASKVFLSLSHLEICHGFVSESVFGFFSLLLAACCCPGQATHKQLKARSAKLFCCRIGAGSSPLGRPILRPFDKLRATDGTAT